MAKVTLTLTSKSKDDLTLVDFEQITWDEADFTWDEANGTWNRQGIVGDRPSKTKDDLTLESK